MSPEISKQNRGIPCDGSIDTEKEMCPRPQRRVGSDDFQTLRKRQKVWLIRTSASREFAFFSVPKGTCHEFPFTQRQFEEIVCEYPVTEGMHRALCHSLP